MSSNWEHVLEKRMTDIVASGCWIEHVRVSVTMQLSCYQQDLIDLQGHILRAGTDTATLFKLHKELTCMFHIAIRSDQNDHGSKPKRYIRNGIEAYLGPWWSPRM
jgi:hypothetical protein